MSHARTKYKYTRKVYFHECIYTGDYAANAVDERNCQRQYSESGVADLELQIAPQIRGFREFGVNMTGLLQALFFVPEGTGLLWFFSRAELTDLNEKLNSSCGTSSKSAGLNSTLYLNNFIFLPYNEPVSTHFLCFYAC